MAISLLAFGADFFTLPAAAAPNSAENSHAGSAWQERSEHMHISSEQRTKYKIDEAAIDLEDGTILVESVTAVTIRTPLAVVMLKPKTLVLVRLEGGMVRCFSLLGNPQVQAGKRLITLTTGEEALVADHTPKAEEVVLHDDIGRRRIRVSDIGDNRGVALTEFSLVHAIAREPLIAHFAQSQNPDDRTMRDHLIKMAAVLNMVTSTHGPYSTGMK
jgi:hypothetical protein